MFLEIAKWDKQGIYLSSVCVENQYKHGLRTGELISGGKPGALALTPVMVMIKFLCMPSAAWQNILICDHMEIFSPLHRTENPGPFVKSGLKLLPSNHTFIFVAVWPKDSAEFSVTTGLKSLTSSAPYFRIYEQYARKFQCMFQYKILLQSTVKRITWNRWNPTERRCAWFQRWSKNRQGCRNRFQFEGVP